MDFLFGFENRRLIREYEEIIRQINGHSKNIRNLSDEELKAKTSEFRERLRNGETLDDILPEAFAVVREASRRYLGIEQYPVQLMGAIALHQGDVAEMKTGEGKTYTAPLAAYLNALTGKSVHIATANDALATRDGTLVTPMFEGLGLTVGVVTEERGSDYRTDIEKRQHAYDCDIIYGSSNAFAFDYLRDNTTTNPNDIVRGDREVGFMIIDEADQILVNDAIMPFKLSGTIKTPNENMLERIKREQMEQDRARSQAKLCSDANSFVYKLFRDKTRIRSFKTEEEMQLYMGGNSEATERANKQFTVLFTKSGEAVLTERGWLEAFRYFQGEEIDKVVNANSKLIIDNPNFEEGKDYTLEDGILSLTLRGLERATREIEEVKKLNNSFYASQNFSELSKAISNSLTAYFVLEQGKEYILEGNATERGLVKKKVLLVSNGRTAEGRVYSDGLQQAIELKEQQLNKRNGIKIEMTQEHDELASISQKAFYSIYPKISGMTGTSAETLFEEIYGMRTARIPKNSEYGVSSDEIDAIYSGREDRDTVLFETDEEKIEAVVSSVLESMKTGQPVLIATTSVTESNRLFKEFQRRGIPCQKLNAEVSNIEEENEIISRAGREGCVTISTQMAGRGTDIKLGGDLEDHVDAVKREIIKARLEQLKAAGVTDEEELRKLEIQVTTQVETRLMDKVRQEAERRRNEEKQRLVEAGGLKVIGYGHFSTKRDDDQLRGRAARQADPGVTEFYCSVRDLRKNLGITNDRIKYLRKKGLSKGNPISGGVVESEISHAQANIEGAITGAISSTQEADYHLSRMRKMVYSQRMRIMKGESPQENMEYIIDTSVINLIDRNLPDSAVEISPRKKLSRTGLNINNLIIDVEETFGIDLTTEFEEGRFSTLGDVERYVSTLAKERYREMRKTNGDEKQDELDRRAIIGTLDDAWLDFNANLEYIKNQNRLNSLAQNQNFDEIFAMKKGFNQSMIDAKIHTVSRMLGRKSTKTRTSEVEEVSFEVDESLNDYYVEDSKKTAPKATNISVRPAKLMAALSNKLKLVRDRIKDQFQLVEVYANNGVTEHVEQIDFENGGTTISSEGMTPPSKK